MADDEPNTTKAYLEPVRVPIMRGEGVAKVRPWTMEDRSQFRPLLSSVLETLATEAPGTDITNIAQVFMAAEPEMYEIAQAAAELPPGVEWKDLLWGDGMKIVQVVWETNILAVDGEGIMGKTMGMLATVLRVIRVRQLAASAKTSETLAATGLASPSDTSPSSTPSSPD